MVIRGYPDIIAYLMKPLSHAVFVTTNTFILVLNVVREFLICLNISTSFSESNIGLI